jgi:hypothetical protein
LDGGQNWQNINGSLPDAVFAIDLIVSRSNNKLRLATHGNGAYELDITQLTATEESNLEVKGYELSQNYPNPFNPTTQINYTLPQASFVRVEVFNNVGQKVADLVAQEQPAGYHTVTFDASGLSSGVYFYKLTTPSFSQTKKMLLVK